MMGCSNSEEGQILFNNPWLIRLVLVFLFILGLGIRLYDLKDPPLDFHPTRQLGSAVISRGMYYQNLTDVPDWQRETAISLWQDREIYEPRILEWIVANSYRILGGEHLWVARIYTSVAWVLGGTGLYFLVRRLTNRDGGLIAVVAFLFLPFGVIASRSFQPDPIMVVLLIYSLLTIHLWSQSPTWRYAILAGIVTGLAILVKQAAIFPIFGAFIGLLVSKWRLKEGFRRPDLLFIIGLAILPTLVYGLILIPERSTGFIQYWTLNFIHLLGDISFYVQWVQMINAIVGFDLLILALFGSLFFRVGGERGMVLGGWVGYVVYGMVFPYQTMTHDYYHLMLVAFIALSLSPIAARILSRITPLRVPWKVLALGIMTFWILVRVWQVKVDLDQRDYRNEAASWRDLRENLPRDGEIISLTQAYGYRIAYFAWVDSAIWPVSADLRLEKIKDGGTFNFEHEFSKRTAGKDYFLVTDFGEFNRQEELKQILYERYPNTIEGDGFIIFDLREDSFNEAEAGTG